METASRVLLARRLGVTLLIMTFALMVLGSWVKATGSGLSCPDWPQCYGQWFPPFPSAENGGIDPDGIDAADGYTQAQILYEWTHRLVASLLGVPFLAFLAVTWTGKGLSNGLRYTPVGALLVLVLQVALGGITVVGKNAAPLTTAHLATATLFIILVTLSVAFAFLRPLPGQRTLVEVRHEPGQTRVVFPGEAAEAPRDE